MRFWKKLFLVLILSCAAVTAICYYSINNPHLFRPGPYHPKSLHYKYLGVDIHPYLDLGDAQYRLVVWETQWPINWRGALGFQDYMEYLAAGFQEIYPNVEVEYRFIRMTDFLEALQEAWEQNDLPDVYAGPFLPALYDLGLVALDPFMEIKEQSMYEPQVLEACYVRDSLVAWPRWVEVYGWGANAQFLERLDAYRLSTEGWTWQDASKFLSGVDQRLPDVTPLILNSAGVDTFEYLMMTAGITSASDQTGNLLWENDCLAQVADFLAGLKKEGLLPRDTGNMHRRFVVDFIGGKAAVVGPAGPGFLRLYRDKYLHKGLDEVNLTMLPIPHPPGTTPSAPCRLNAVVALDRGDPARASLSARLARYLSRGAVTWLTAEACGVPAYYADREAWRIEVGLPDSVVAFLEEAVKRPIFPQSGSLEQVLQEAVISEEVITPEVRNFWLGEVDSKGLVERIKLKVSGQE